MRQYDYSLWTILKMGKKPTSLEIEEHMIAIIQNRAVQPGEPIPSHRTIAKLNNVNRNTALRAYTKLIATGWLTHTKGSRAIVAEAIPNSQLTTNSSNIPNALPIALNQTLTVNKNVIKSTQLEFVEVGLPIIDKVNYVFKNRQKPIENSNSYSHISKKSLERAVYDNMLLQRHKILPENMFMIRGRKECLKFLFNLICDKDKKIINTAPLDSLLCLTLDECGVGTIQIETLKDCFLAQLEKILKKEKISAVYVRPRANYPYCQSLDEATCHKLIDLAKAHNFYIIEEDDDHEVWWKQYPSKPLVQMQHLGHVIYCSAFSRSSEYSQHLRIIVGPAQLIHALKFLPNIQQGYRDYEKEKLLKLLIGSNELATISRSLRLRKQKDLKLLHDILQLQLGKYISYKLPDSGTALWIEFFNEIDLSAMFSNLINNGHKLKFMIFARSSTTKIKYMRLDFSTFDPQECKKIAISMRDFLNRSSKT